MQWFKDNVLQKINFFKTKLQKVRFPKARLPKVGFPKIEFRKTIYGTVGALGISLLMMAVVGNVFLGNLSVADDAMMTASDAKPVSAELEQQYTDEMMEAAAETALFPEVRQAEQETNKEMQSEEASAQILQNSIASLRMERDSSWQCLRERMSSLSEIQQQKLETYAMLQYKEQRLELLLQARGLDHCLVVLEEEQANVIASEKALAEQYEKIYDVVQRNTDYTAEQIVLVPMKTKYS